MNLPNFISLGRLFLTPLLVWLIVIGNLRVAFWVFVIAGVSDILDGLLARLLKDQTTIGRYLDPLADKVLLVGVFLTLGVKSFIPPWLVILVVSRDIMILGGALFLLIFNRSIVITPILISKVNTFFQILLVGVVLWGPALEPNLPLITLLFYMTATTTIISGIAYVIKWIRELNKNEIPAHAIP